METIDLPIPGTSETSETSSALNGNRKPGWGKATQCQIAKTLFICPEFVPKPFGQMGLQDWRLHASLVWDIAEVFVGEMAQRYPAKGKEPDESKADGRKDRRIASRVEDLLAFIPTDSVVLRKDLFEQTRGKIARDDFRSYVTQLLCEERIFAHKIPHRTHPLIAYSRKAPLECDTEITEAEKLMSRPSNGYRSKELERIAGE